MTPNEIREAVKAGDQKVFRDLVTEFRPLVYRVAARFFQSHDDCDDLTQDVFVEIWRSIHHYRGDAALSTWIYRITVNKALNLVKKRKRFVFTSLFSSEAGGLEQASGGDEPFRGLLRSEGARLIDAALARLPDSQRTAFILTQAEGLSQREAAEVMNITESSVESLLHRARTNLRKRLKDYYYQA